LDAANPGITGSENSAGIPGLQSLFVMQNLGMWGLDRGKIRRRKCHMLLSLLLDE